MKETNSLGIKTKSELEPEDNKGETVGIVVSKVRLSGLIYRLLGERSQPDNLLSAFSRVSRTGTI